MEDTRPALEGARQLVSVPSRRTTDFFGFPLGWYWKKIYRFVMGLVFIDILLALAVMLDSFRNSGIQAVALPAELAIFAGIGWLFAARYKKGFLVSAVGGGLAGSTLGLIMGIIKLALIHEQWTVFNVFTEPIFAGIAGALVSGSVGAIMQKMQQRSVKRLNYD